MNERQPVAPAKRGARKRSDLVADRIKRWIMDARLPPGERLPQEKDLIARFGVSKGTIREALKSLEVQGLVKVRTGPGGGAAVAEVTVDRASELLSNYFYSREITLREVYTVRKSIEPKLAETVVGHVSAADLEALERCIDFCSCEPFGVQTGRMQRIVELDFHDVLADACPNPVLAFYCRFLNTLLKNLAVCQKIYATPQRELARRAREFHVELVEAFRAEDRAAASRAMYEHMVEAERILLEHEAVVEHRFLLDEDLRGTASR